MTWHVGLLYRLGDILKLLNEKHITQDTLLSDLPTFRGVQVQSLLTIALRANWIHIGETGGISLTSSGRSLIDIHGPTERLRVQIRTLMDVLSPYWAPIVVQGRQAFAQYAPAEVVQCFREAGMLTTTESDVIRWWDSISARYRNYQDKQKVETGREGERLSFHYERHRTGKEPFWIALEFTGAGYDIRSSLASNCNNTLLIEVKTSRKPWDNATFHLTHHEWEVLNLNQYSVLHLWSLAIESPILSVVPIKHLNNHIPLNRGNGNWEIIECPFATFDQGVDLTSGQEITDKLDSLLNSKLTNTHGGWPIH